MDEQIKETLIGALHIAKGDDLERAEKHFAVYSDDEMNVACCHDCQSPREVLEGYRAERKRYNDAEEWVRNA